MNQPTATLVLKPGREKPVLNRHPWVFSGSIRHIRSGDPDPGDLVTITAHDGRFLARAYYNPQSQITARILTWDPDEALDADFWHARLDQARRLRSLLELEPKTNAYRLVNGEADGVPGLIVDRYGDFLVLQALTLGIDVRKRMLIETAAALFQPIGIVERSDVSVRKKEGLDEVRGLVWGVDPPDSVTVRENDHLFEVDLMRGHKTGLYLDQRQNRNKVCQPNLVRGRKILNVFSYTGGFAVYAAVSGAAQIINIDESATSIDMARKNLALNATNRQQDKYLTGDAFTLLREFRDTGQSFDMVILDPPKFAHSRRDVEAACRGYKDLNWLALRLLRPDGLLATFSCSGRVSADLFQKVVFSAAVDADRHVQIVQQLSQAADHPVSLTFPESAYLKGFLCRVI
ncbi:MAG: class I SAM-dependent methyltransferase [Candidatus Promineifilaceae bacterium]|nr:class I SAM-dependent methyltransferase [Candidatus Promineifilaceae bacterium]